MINVGPAFFKTATALFYPYLVYDTFTGGGDLASHIGEKGTPWIGGGATYTLSGGFVCPTTGVGLPTFADQSETFQDGYVDIEFTIAEDVVPPIPYYDNFNGSGNLLSHTSDSLHTYTEIPGNNDPIENLLLTGGTVYSSGVIAGDPWGSARVVPQIILPSRFSVTAVLNIGAHTSTGYTVLRFNLSNNFTTGIEISATTIYFTVYGNSAQIPYVSGTHTFRIVRTDTEDQLYFDGSLVLSNPVYTPEPTDPFEFYLNPYYFGPGGSSVLAIESLALEHV